MMQHRPDQLRQRAARLLALAKEARKEGQTEFGAQLERLAAQAYREAAHPPAPPKKPKSE
jgi:hypothetical protein